MVVLLGLYSEGVVELRGGVEGAGCGVMMNDVRVVWLCFCGG